MKNWRVTTTTGVYTVGGYTILDALSCFTAEEIKNIISVSL